MPDNTGCSKEALSRSRVLESVLASSQQNIAALHRGCSLAGQPTKASTDDKNETRTGWPLSARRADLLTGHGLDASSSGVKVASLGGTKRQGPNAVLFGYS